MTAGFWFLKDGREYTQRVKFMITLMKQIHKELSLLEDAKEFSEYLRKYILTDDYELNKYGDLYNKTTGESVTMNIDFREFTEKNQDLFWQATQQCLHKLVRKNNIKHRVLIKELKVLLDMNKRATKGENSTKSNMRFTAPPTGKKKGPGWDSET